MTIEVLYFAELKDITKKPKESFNLHDLNMKELLERLFEKYDSISSIIWDNSLKNLKSNVSIAINNTFISTQDKLSIPLSDGDKVAFLLPISGG